MDQDRPQRTRLGDYSMSLDDAIAKATQIVSRQFEPNAQPNLENVTTILLSESKRTWKIAKYWGIRNPNTGHHSHNTLTLETLSRTKKHGWESKVDKSITIDDKPENDSINKLFSFLASQSQIDTDGRYIVVNITDVAGNQIQQILNAISGNRENQDLISKILEWITGDAEARAGLSRLATSQEARSLVAAINHKRLSRTLDEFRALVEQNLEEPNYQKFLKENHWIFGGEYNVLLTNRNIIKNGQLDFPALRTADGYLEIIEIKRPIKEKLFRPNRKTYSEIAAVVDAISQTDDYLARVDKEAFQIESEDELDVEKVRGKVIIGRDIEDHHDNEIQKKALRRLNARTNRIEVMTYDQLIGIAQKILNLLSNEKIPQSEGQEIPEDNPQSSVDDIPF